MVTLRRVFPNVRTKICLFLTVPNHDYTLILVGKCLTIINSTTIVTFKHGNIYPQCVEPRDMEVDNKRGTILFKGRCELILTVKQPLFLLESCGGPD